MGLFMHADWIDIWGGEMGVVQNEIISAAGSLDVWFFYILSAD